MGAPGSLPKSTSTKRKSTTLGYLFKLESGDTNGVSHSSEDTETDHIISMITYCTFVFTFTDPLESETQQELKRSKLSDILSFIRSPNRPPLDSRLISTLITMLSANLFRPLPPPAIPNCSHSDTLDDDPATLALAPSWPHLHVIYDILSATATCTDAKTLRCHISHNFLSSLLALFQSEDPRERERLKNVYHQLYSRLTSDREFMRRSMNHVFLRYAADGERHSGIGELLEIWGSIINGFTVPVKEEHRVFLMRVLVPLHKPKGMPAYHRQLSYCVSQFVEKEPGLGDAVVRGVLRHWPLTNCHKEVLMIGELEDLVEVMEEGQFDRLAVPVCVQIARCLNSSNSQVAERALSVWNNDHFLKMASRSMEKVLPPIVEGIEKNIKWHWSKPVQQLSINVKMMLEEIEPGLYSKCLNDLECRAFAAIEAEMKRRNRWERLEIAATNGVLAV